MPNYGSVISLEEIKSYLRINFADDDALLTDLIPQVISNCEKIGRISIPITSRFVTYSTMKRGKLFLPYGTVKSVDRVILLSDDGSDDTELTRGTDYVFREGDHVIKFHSLAHITDYYPSIRIEYTAGYEGDELDTVNSNLKLAIKQFVVHCYEHRGDDKRTAVNMPKETRRILGEYWTSPTYHT